MMRLLRFLAIARMFRGGRRRSHYRQRSPYGFGGGGFGGRRYHRRGRVQVVGCAPGCLMTSLLLSIALTIVVNIIIRAF